MGVLSRLAVKYVTCRRRHFGNILDPLKLSVATQDQEAAQRQKEANKIGKHFFVKFRIKREDVSSKTGEIEGWLARDGIPTKGVIKDVVFFGDLWGELVNTDAEGH